MTASTRTAVIAVLCLAWLYRIGSQPETRPVSAAVPADARSAWAIDLAGRLGNAQPSADMIAFLVAWTNAEDRSDEALARFNPLNTSQPASGSWAINSDNVQGYPDYETGMRATVETLLAAHPGYDFIVAGIQTNDVELALSGLQLSPWGTHAGTTAAIYQQQAAPAIGGKSVVTDAMTVSADFYATGAPAWNGGIHGGVDYNAPHGSPVYMPFDCAYTMTGHYDDPGRYGDYLICHLMDGYEYYSGHLENVQPFSEGQVITAGTLIGFTNELDHTHIQLRDTAGNLIDFQHYYQEH